MIDPTHTSAHKPDRTGKSDQLSFFQYEWQIYQKLVHDNAMNHREIAAILRSLITERFKNPFSFIDLACGDASLALSVLKGTSVRSYEGIDLCRPALELAKKNLAGAHFQVTLSEEDMVSAMKTRRSAADVIWCGFSIHHLKTLAQKQEILTAIYDALRPGGVFVCFEPTGHSGETRDDYLKRNQQTLRQRFHVLSDEEFAHMWDHISDHDFPESAETWLAAGKQAGFSHCREILRMPGELFCAAFLYEKGI